MFASYSYILNAIDPPDIMNAVIDLRIPQLRTRIFSVIQKKQNGKCHWCKINITLSDTVVSNGSGRGYYHKSCGEKLHIL